MRRTGIFDEDGADIDRILYEDGYALVPEEQAATGDVVLFSDERGYSHACRIDRHEPRVALMASFAPDAPTSSQVAVVLSKFDEFSGEYEHRIDDLRWANGIANKIERHVYRDRHETPKSAPRGRWRSIV